MNAGAHAWKVLMALHESWGTAQTIAKQTGLTVEQVEEILPEIADIEPATLHGNPANLNGRRLWRIKAEPCHFVEAGEADRKAISGAN